VKRWIVALSLAVAGWAGTGLSAHPALAANLCVGSGPSCYTTIQDALNAAQNGDAIHLGPGTFAGGVTIDKSVSLLGAGPRARRSP
jgi:pectin methylesterase-like acyl-CoA thioesterase